MERQLTTARHGHVLTNAAVWSPSGDWIVYDVRSDAGGANFDGKEIQAVHVRSKRVVAVHRAQASSRVGVALFSPVSNLVVFIEGPSEGYAAHNRRGVICARQSARAYCTTTMAFAYA